jgi:hypothetical protein
VRDFITGFRTLHFVGHVRTLAIERFGLTEARLPKPTRWLGEVRSPSS